METEQKTDNKNDVDRAVQSIKDALFKPRLKSLTADQLAAELEPILTRFQNACFTKGFMACKQFVMTMK